MTNPTMRDFQIIAETEFLAWLETSGMKATVQSDEKMLKVAKGIFEAGYTAAATKAVKGVLKSLSLE